MKRTSREKQISKSTPKYTYTYKEVAPIVFGTIAIGTLVAATALYFDSHDQSYQQQPGPEPKPEQTRYVGMLPLSAIVPRVRGCIDVILQMVAHEPSIVAALDKHPLMPSPQIHARLNMILNGDRDNNVGGKHLRSDIFKGYSYYEDTTLFSEFLHRFGIDELFAFKFKGDICHCHVAGCEESDKKLKNPLRFRAHIFNSNESGVENVILNKLCNHTRTDANILLPGYLPEPPDFLLVKNTVHNTAHNGIVANNLFVVNLNGHLTNYSLVSFGIKGIYGPDSNVHDVDSNGEQCRPIFYWAAVILTNGRWGAIIGGKKVDVTKDLQRVFGLYKRIDKLTN